MVLHHNKIAYSMMLCITLLTSSSVASPNNEELVKSIIQLRGDVESLYSQIKENKERYNAQMKSLYIQITDSQAQNNTIETSIKLESEKLKQLRVKIKEESSKNQDIQPLVYEAIEILQKSIQEGIPFMVPQRISDLQKIKTDMESHTITSQKALALVWAGYEDMVRLTKEIGLFKQEILFKGEKVLAKVAKLGSVALFFSTPKGDVGFVQQHNNQYSYKHITDPEDKEKIVILFDALQKQIRTGFFELPNALVLQGER